MATVARMSVAVQANVSGFNRGMSKGRRDLKGFSAAASKANGVVKRMGSQITGAIAPIVSLGAAVAIANKALAIMRERFEALDKLGKTADKLGVTTEHLAGMHLAAARTGVEVNTMNMALQRMVRRIAEAAQGTGEAQGALRELGLDAGIMATLAPDEQFRILSDAMLDVAGSGDKVRLAMKLFDSEGVALVNTMALGSEGLNQMQKEAEELGLTMDREAVRSIEKSNDAWAAMSDAVKGIANVFAEEFAPALTAVAEQLREMQRSLNFDAMKKTVGGMVDLLTIYNDFKSGQQLQATSEILARGAELRGNTDRASQLRTQGKKFSFWPDGLTKRTREQRDAVSEARETAAAKKANDPFNLPQIGNILAESRSETETANKAAAAVGTGVADAFKKTLTGGASGLSGLLGGAVKGIQKGAALRAEAGKFIPKIETAQPQFAAAAEQGSLEAYRAQNRHAGNNPIVDISKQQLNQLKVIADALLGKGKEAVEKVGSLL